MSKDRETMWYACMVDRDDTDWGFGDYDLNEALRIVKQWIKEGHEEAYIAVIKEGEYDNICIDEIIPEV